MPKNDTIPAWFTDYREKVTTGELRVKAHYEAAVALLPLRRRLRLRLHRLTRALAHARRDRKYLRAAKRDLRRRRAHG